jgi:hypothetical protein
VNLKQAEVLLNAITLGNAILDTAMKVKFAVDKISAMSDEGCDRYNQDQNLISDELMKELDTI